MCFAVLEFLIIYLCCQACLWLMCMLLIDRKWRAELHQTRSWSSPSCSGITWGTSRQPRWAILAQLLYCNSEQWTFLYFCPISIQLNSVVFIWHLLCNLFLVLLLQGHWWKNIFYIMYMTWPHRNSRMDICVANGAFFYVKPRTGSLIKIEIQLFRKG